MSRRLTHDLTYDAPLAGVIAMLADPAFRDRVCDYRRVLRHHVTIEPSDAGNGAGMHVSIDQVQAGSGLPSFVTKIIGDEIHIVQDEVWSSAEHADLTIAIPGKPIHVSGTIALSESGGVTTETVDVTIKVGIPLVGGKIEELIADMLLKALVAENKVGRGYGS